MARYPTKKGHPTQVVGERRVTRRVCAVDDCPHPPVPQGQLRGAAPYIPQTLIAIPLCCALRRQIFLLQATLGRRSKMTRYASSTPVASA